MDGVIEFEQRMAALAEQLSPDAKALLGEVLTLEWRHRFVERGKLPEEFATQALRAVKRRSEGGA